MKKVYLKRFNSIAESELAKNLLKEYGILAWVHNTGVEIPRDLGDFYGADLFVAEQDFQKAKEILE
jgi:hypothetical protein